MKCISYLILALENKERLEEMKRIFHDELPDENYFILKYLINFLQEVSVHREICQPDIVTSLVFVVCKVIGSKLL